MSWLRSCMALLALALAFPAAAVDENDLLPVDQAYVLSASAPSRDRIELRWKIHDGYYLYRHRTSVTATGFNAGPLQLPKGEPHHDEFFGDVETYRGELLGVLAGTASTDTVTLKVKYQGCADAGICYPPQTRTLTVALPPTAAATTPLPGARPAGASLFGLGAGSAAGATDAAPLPAEQAFQFEAIANNGDELLLRFTPAPGYYLYRDRTSMALEGAKGVALQRPEWPKGTNHRDEHFGDVVVYFDQVEVPVPLLREHDRAFDATLKVTFQGCQKDGICYPPMTRRVKLSVPEGTISQPSEIEAPAMTPMLAPLPGADANASAPAVEGASAASTNPAASADAANPPRQAPPAGAGKAQTIGLWLALLLALGGGLILNLMPCVLPVLSLKALSLAQSGESRESARRHALAYTAGVLVSFAALGALVLALRKAGLALGWGFQLQQPLVVAVLALVVFVFGLSLSGLWYASIGIGQRGSALMQGGGTRADFFTGVLAVVLATPCTAPFMGSALAYAFAGPAAGGMLVFLMLGLGLALPFLLIGFVPALARLLPKPGAWMETLKQLLAFPMYVTAAWLLFVLASLRGAEAVWQWLLAAIGLAFVAWAWTRSLQTGRNGWKLAALLALVATAWPLATLHRLQKPETASAATARDGIARVAYSEQALADLRAQHRVVFVNMTADWCVSCKVNEKAVFARAGFRTALESANAVYMVGDYTDVDPAITAFLERHKAVGVPLYVVYPRNGGEGEVLPTLVTQSMVDAALQRAAQ